MKNKFGIAITLNIFITLAEIVVGVLIGSLAVISDAVHNFFDIGSMALAWWGEKVSGKKSDLNKTYGYKRAEILVAFVNSLILVLSVVIIGFESVQRLLHPQPVEGGWMLLIAGVALIGNGIATIFLHKDSDHNLNLKAAFLHSLQDALFSAGVMVGAILVLIFHWNIIDPLISIVLSVFLLKEAIELVKGAVDVLMESVPEGVDMEALRKSLLILPNIKKVSDLHVWQTGSQEILLTVHILADLKNSDDYAKVLQSIKDIACEKYNIIHTTIQLVPIEVEVQLGEVCTHCN